MDHLSRSQRKIFKEEELIMIITREIPYCVGLQKNGRYSPFFRRKESFIRMIIEIKDKVEIVTFMYTDKLPSLERIQNEK